MPQIYGTPEWDILLQRLRENDPTLTQLNLRDNKIGDSGVQDLSAALKDNHTLIQLNLRSNKIGVSGAQALSVALEGNSTLNKLNLRSNLILVGGAQALSATLKNNHTLTQLNLYGNHIGVRGARALSATLEGNCTLTKLDLYSNQIMDSGAQALSDALKKNQNHSLTQLDLNGNHIHDKSLLKEIEDQLKNRLRNTFSVNSNNNSENIYQTMPTAFFSPQPNRQGLSNADSISQKLAKYVPAEIQLGKAIGQGDCFFDAIAQALNQLTGKEEYTLKSLRILCDEYVKDPNHTWVKEAIVKDNDNYEQYLARIRFTADEMEEYEQKGVNLGPAVWGRPTIEGRMFCERFNKKIHVIEILEEAVDSSDIMEQLVDAKGTQSIEPLAKTAYSDPTMLHLVVYKNHFVPLLYKTLVKVFQQAALVHSYTTDSNNNNTTAQPVSLEFNYTPTLLALGNNQIGDSRAQFLNIAPIGEKNTPKNEVFMVYQHDLNNNNNNSAVDSYNKVFDMGALDNNYPLDYINPQTMEIEPSEIPGRAVTDFMNLTFDPISIEEINYDQLCKGMEKKNNENSNSENNNNNVISPPKIPKAPPDLDSDLPSFLPFQQPELSEEERCKIGRRGEQVIYRTLKKHYENKYQAEINDRDDKKGFSFSTNDISITVTWHNKGLPDHKDSRHPHDITIDKIKNNQPRPQRCVEVKTTRNGEPTDANISENQIKEMFKYKNHYRIFRVYNAGQKDTFFKIIKNPAKAIFGQEKLPELEVTGLKIKI